MTIEERNKYLEHLAKTKQGEALKEFLEEKIAELRDVTRLPAEHLEVQARANIMAILKMKEVMRTLELLKKERPKRKQNPYM